MEKLQALHLHAFAKAWEEQQQQPDVLTMSFDERLGLLVDAEWLARENARVTSNLREAKLRISQASLEDVDFNPKRELDKPLVRQLANCRWVLEHQNVIITGMTGTGKTYLACALAQAAIRKGHRAVYRRAPRLFEELALAHADGSFPALLKRLAKVDVLVIDDWGLARLRTRSGATCSRSSRTATAPAAPSSPANYPRPSGTTTSATPPSLTRSATACYTAPTAWC